MKDEELEQGFRDLRLDDPAVRKTLAELARPIRSSPGPAYDTITAAHTSDVSKKPPDAKLEPGS